LDFLEIFPEAALIEDKDIKEKVQKSWEKAIQLGGWKEKDLTSIPFTLLIPNTAVNIVEHTRAVTNVALRIAETLKNSYKDIIINKDYLIAGGLLHDVGKLLEYEFSPGGYRKSGVGELLRHPVSGANLASVIGLPSEVIHIIYTHSREGDSYKRTIESIIIHYSDFINFEGVKEGKSVKK